MVYPLLTSVKGLRKKLIADKVFVACYWPNVVERTQEDLVEYNFASQMLPLPIDQRYGEKELNGMVERLNDLVCQP